MARALQRLLTSAPRAGMRSPDWARPATDLPTSKPHSGRTRGHSNSKP